MFTVWRHVTPSYIRCKAPEVKINLEVGSVSLTHACIDVIEACTFFQLIIAIINKFLLDQSLIQFVETPRNLWVFQRRQIALVNLQLLIEKLSRACFSINCTWNYTPYMILPIQIKVPFLHSIRRCFLVIYVFQPPLSVNKLPSAWLSSTALYLQMRTQWLHI
jgi:hypothetical protein